METKYKWIAALAVVAVLAGLLLPVCKYDDEEIVTADIRRRMAFDAVDDSYVYGGADIIWYSDNHSTEKATIDGAAGNASFDGTLTAGSQATLSNGLALTGQFTMTGGSAISGDLDVAGNIKSTSGSVRINDGVLITGTVGVSSQVSADGLYSTNAITTTGNATVVGLTVSGNVADSGTLFRVNDNTLITGTVSVSSKATVDNLAVNQNVTVTGNLVVNGTASYTSLTIAEPMQDSGTTFRIADPLSVTGTLAVEGPISDHGTLLRLEDNTVVTGTLGVSGQITADGLSLSNAMTSTANATVVGLTVSGNVADSGINFRVNDNSLITGTLGVSSQVTADGFKSTNAISSTGVLTVTNWGLFYGIAFMPQYSIAITTNGAINPTTYSLVLLSDTGGQATDNVTLNATTSINDGTYLGQLLMIKFVDTDGAGMIIKNGANTKLPGAGDCTLTVNDVLTLFWDGVDWVAVSKSDN